jgi:uncharacterized protein (TIGR00725 family)
MNKADHEKNYARRLKIVGVFGSGETCDPALATSIGELIARKGFHLLTGAGGGTMTQVSEAFYKVQSRAGLVLGIVRAGVQHDQAFDGARREYRPNAVNDWVEVPIYTHLRRSDKTLDSRNPVNVLSSDLAIVLPGGSGTGSEVELALEYGVPVIFFLGNGTVDSNGASHYLARYPGSRIVEAKTIGEVEAELDRL